MTTEVKVLHETQYYGIIVAPALVLFSTEGEREVPFTYQLINKVTGVLEEEAMSLAEIYNAFVEANDAVVDLLKKMNKVTLVTPAPAKNVLSFPPNG